MVVSLSNLSFYLPLSLYLYRNFRAYRVKALSKLWHMQATGPSSLRVLPESLLLTAATVWLVNGLHARPDDKPASRALMHAALPLDEASTADPFTMLLPARRRRPTNDTDVGLFGDDPEFNDSDELVPVCPYGVVFFRRVKIDVPVPRFWAGGHALDDQSFRFWFKGSIDEIKRRYDHHVIIPTSHLPHTSIARNKTRMTTNIEQATDEAEANMFQLAIQGHELHPAITDGEPDLILQLQTSEQSDIDPVASHIWRLCLIDLARKSPNKGGKGGHPYLKRTMAERETTTEDLFNIRILSNIWIAVQWKNATNDDWRRAFDYLFPPKGTQIAKLNTQNFSACNYFARWSELIDHNQESVVQAIRDAYWQRFKNLSWIPQVTADRIWNTSFLPKQFRRLPPGTTGPAPRILINTSIVPVWNNSDDDSQ